jgi:ribosomal-protein-alanine N-acetyltransferase
MRPDDLDRILEIERASFGLQAYDCKLFAYYARRCGDLFLIAVKEGKICGYMLSCVRGARAELVSVAVDPARRQTGAGSAMLRSTLRRLRLRRVEWLHLMVRIDNHSAIEFYEKHGFRRVRRVRGYYEDGGDGIRMNLRTI